MPLRDRVSRLRLALGLLVGALSVIALGTLTGLAAQQLSISQKGREFRPNEISLSRGDSVMVVNDDADLQHHVYIDADNFKFDSGDQEPGSKTPITFPIAGDFDVLCAIHPKMKLIVHVK